MSRNAETEASIALCLSCTRKHCSGDCAARNRLSDDRKSNHHGRRAEHFYTVDGVKASLTHWSKVSGIPASTLKHRLDSGMTIKQAMNTPLRTRKPPKKQREPTLHFTVNGVTTTVPRLSEMSGVSMSTIYRRLRSGMTIEEAITPSETRGRNPVALYTIDGVTGSLAEWSRRTGIAYQTLRYRLCKGMTLAEAIASGSRGDPSPSFTP